MKTRKLKLKTIKIIGILPQIMAYILALIMILTKDRYLGYIAISVLFIDGIFLFLQWRCPQCHKHIGPLWAKSCSKCGEKIN